MLWLNRQKIKVHGWGGLGSQLYTLSTAFQLKNSFPNREIVLILHTSGVTKRVSEISQLVGGIFSTSQVDDYSKTTKVDLKSISLKAKSADVIKSIIRKILTVLGFVATANTQSELEKIRPWVNSLRGHYFYRKPPDYFLNFLLDRLSKFRKPPKQGGDRIAIHYRMGDLLTLVEKSITPIEIIVEQINKALKLYPSSKIIVYTDSPSEAHNSLTKTGLNQGFEVRDVPPLEVLGECLDADFFIGTNSKISVWIVNLRRHLGKVDSNYLEGFDRQLIP